MVPCKRLALSLSLLFCVLAAAKDKKKIVLPVDVLQARTVLVVIDPDAGTAVDAPMANRTARDAVENALMELGPFPNGIERVGRRPGHFGSKGKR